MLPIPFINYIPKIFQRDQKAITLSNKVDEHLTVVLEEINGVKRLIRPDEVDAKYLNYLGFHLNAGILNTDSEIIKRRKIRDAVATHKKRGLWEDDAKIRIDNITGYDAVIFRSIDSADWLLLEDNTDGRYYATMGCDGIDDELGLNLIGDGTEIEISGNIYIDCHDGVHTAVLTAAQIAQIVNDIEYDVVPAYYIIYLGYIDSTGAFQVYSGGIIG